jgi:Lysylphosphatidylglycerol synthase TM region
MSEHVLAGAHERTRVRATGASRRVRLVFFALGLAGVALIVARVGVTVLLADVRRAGWTLVPVALVWAVVYALNTTAWLLLLDGPTIPFARAYGISVSAFALNYVTPFLALGGEPLRVASAAAWVGVPRAASSVVAFRVVHTAGQIVFWLLCVPVAFMLLPATAATRVLLALTALVLVAIVLLLGAALRAGTVERLLALLLRAPPLRAAPLRAARFRRVAVLLARQRGAVRALDTALGALARERPARLALALAIETTGRLVAVLEFLLIARSVGAPVDYAAAAMISGFSQLVMNVLFFVPFEIGAKEGSLLAAFALLGHAPHIAAAAAVMSRLRELIWITIGLSLIWFGGRSTNE